MTWSFDPYVMLKQVVAFFVVWLFATPSFTQETTESASSNQSKVSVEESKGKKKTTTAQENNPTLNSLNGGGSGWRFQGTLTHLPTERRDQETTTDVLLRADYTINKKHRVRIQQYFNKVYTKYESEYDFQPADTQLVHFYRLDYKPAGIGLQWRNSISLPISNASSRDDLITRIQTSIIAAKPLLGGKLISFFVPYLRYHAYEFALSRSGTPLPLTTVGASLGGLYFLTPKLSFYGGLNYNVENTRESQFEPDPTYQFNRGIYRFDLDLSYMVTNHVTASLSYNQGAALVQDGRYELMFYDDQVSRVGLGLTYIY